MSSAQRLSALEAAFLGIETRDVPFEYACILCFDRPIDLETLRAHVDRVLVTVPRYRQRIERNRLGRATWVDDDEYRTDQQILAATVAAPGGTDELDELAAQLISRGLPPGHAPWRMWTVGGLAGGRGAVIALVHHSLVDGIAGFRMLEHLMRAELRTEPEAARPSAPRPRDRLATLRALLSWKHFGALGRLLRDGLRPASKVGLNPRHTGRTRAVASYTVELDRVRTIEDAFGATNNDVVLATVAGALRRFLGRRGFDTQTLRDVRAMVPVGRHAAGDEAAAGNRVVLMLAPLPIDEPDPVECLHRISSATRGLKSSGAASGGDLLVAISDLTTPALLAGVLRLALRARAFNAIVTNVPGPKTSRSLLGAQLTRVVPVVNLWPHQSLGIAVASYAGALTFGIQTDRAVIPDIRLFRDDLATAFAELVDAAAHARAA